MAPTEQPDAAFRLGYRPGLDGLRGLALIVVVLFHAQLPFIKAGHMGLTIFFVLSGFLITVLMLQEFRDAGDVQLGRFFARRTLRIYPALLVFLPAVGLYTQLTASPATARAHWLSVVSVFTGVSNIVHGATSHPLILLEHTWSIAVELQFYLLWPIVLLWALRRGTPWRVIATWMLRVAVAVVIVRAGWWLLATLPDDVTGTLATAKEVARRTAFARVYPRILTGTDLRVDHLMIGCLVGLAAFHGQLDRLQAHRRRVVAASLLAVAYITWFTVTVDVDWWDFMFSGGSTLVAISAAVIIITCIVVADSPVPRVLANRVLVWFGTISYGVYLWHVPLYRILRERVPDWSLWEQAAVGGIAAVLLALLSYHLIERRALAQKRRFEPRQRIDQLHAEDERVPAISGG